MNLLEEFAKFGRNDWRILTKYQKDPIKFRNNAMKFDPIVKRIEADYPHLPFPEAVYWAKNGLTENPTCECCGKLMSFNYSVYTYNTFCSAKCKSSAQPTNAEAIIVNGIQYNDFPKAMKATGESRMEIRKKIFDPNVTDYQWVGDHDAICLKKLHDIHPDLTNRDVLLAWKASGESNTALSVKYNKNRETIIYAMIYWDIDRKFNQIPPDVKAFLEDEEAFTVEFNKTTAAAMAMKYGVSSSLMLQYGDRYGLDTNKGYTKSAIEIYFASWLNENTSFNIEESSKIGNGCNMHMDIFVPEKRLAIELNGIIYHAENSPVTAGRDSTYHRSKYVACRDNNISLLSFMDVGETSDKTGMTIVKSMIMSKLGMNSRIYARKCTIREVGADVARPFFDKTHISGFCAASRYIALYHDDECVQIMSFSKPRFNKRYDWEIIRLSSKLNVTIVGGASKIFKYFLSTSTGNVMSYADLRFGDGKVYSTLGMSRLTDTDPGYMYVKGYDRFSRFQFQKKTIQKHCPIYDPTLSETQNALNNGYLKIWDCGNAVYEFNRS